MKYKILVPVLAQVEEFRELMTQIPDKEKLIIINNWDNKDVAEQCEALLKQGAEIVNFPKNRGCAGAWNVGLRRVESGELDYLVILSPSCSWVNDVNDFVNIIEESEKKEKNYFYHARGNFVTDTHAFAITKKCIDAVGLFDENFYPVYFEDTDYSYRRRLVGAESTPVYPLRKSHSLGLGVNKDKRVWDVYAVNAERLKAYYTEKWGGEVGSETFTHPYNNPELTIRDWRPFDYDSVWR